MKAIKLTRGKYALVDDEDFEWLSQWKWRANKIGKTFYAIRGKRVCEGGPGTVYMHRELLKTDQYVDHIDGNGLNNFKSNLREATHKQNLENRGPTSKNKSGHKGVYFCKERRKWCAYIRHYGKTKNLGRFDNLQDAIDARKSAEKKYFTHCHQDPG